MPKKRANVYRRRNGSWTAHVRVNGRSTQATFRTLEEAELYVVRMKQRRLQGAEAPTATRLADFANEWLSSQESRIRPTTYSRYEVNLRLHLLPTLGHLKLGDVSPDHIARLITKLERGKKAAWTVRQIVGVLGRVLAAAHRHGLIDANPVRALLREERPKTTRREIPMLDTADIGKLIAATPKPYKTLVAVSVFTGVRQSEALALRWEDVDLRDGVIRVRRQLGRDGTLVEPKTSAAKRDIPIPPSLATMLKTHRETAFQNGHARQTDYVFASRTGSPLNHRNVVHRGLDKALKTSGLPKLTWHDLRHVAASALIAEGASVAYVSRMLGHSSPSVTLGIYAHAFAAAEHADRTRETMERAFGGLLT